MNKIKRLIRNQQARIYGHKGKILKWKNMIIYFLIENIIYLIKIQILTNLFYI